MINDIFSSFFRTIGRILAYLLLGALVGYLFTISGCEPVKAEVVSMTSSNAFFGVEVNGYTSFPRGFSSSAYQSDKSLFDVPIYLYNYEGVTRPYKYLITTMCMNSVPQPYIYGGSSSSSFSNVYSLYNTGKSCLYNGYNGNLFMLQIPIAEYEDFDGTGGELMVAGRLQFLFYVNWLPFIQFIDFSLSSDDILTDVVQNQALINDLIEKNQAIIDKQQETNDKLDDVIKEENETQDKIDENTKEQQETNDLITSDEIDTGSSDSFFNNFSTEDNGGISSIVTAPLKMIRSITETCLPLSIPFYDNDIELPCGDTLFWNRADVKTFRNTWNIIIGGPIIYMLLVKLFQVIQNIKNPGNSKVEVMKL